MFNILIVHSKSSRCDRSIMVCFTSRFYINGSISTGCKQWFSLKVCFFVSFFHKFPRNSNILRKDSCIIASEKCQNRSKTEMFICLLLYCKSIPMGLNGRNVHWIYNKFFKDSASIQFLVSHLHVLYVLCLLSHHSSSFAAHNQK